MPDTDLQIPRIFRLCGLSQGPDEGPFVKELSATYLDVVHETEAEFAGPVLDHRLLQSSTI